MEHVNDKILTYAINREGKLVHIESVPNGLDCGCICPSCLTELIAKNNGQYRAKHFAHRGDVCAAYYETTLHLLAKDIIKEEKTVMLPAYKNVESTRAYFKEVEVEERNDSSVLQPDCVGITEEGLRIHVEIFVTHKVDERKKEKIERNDINCVEIRIPNDFPLDREQLKDFIENKDEKRVWINYPYGEEINAKIEKERREKAIQEMKERQERAIREKKERALWNMTYRRDKTTRNSETKPKTAANAGSPPPAERKNITMEQYRKDMDNDICPLCGARIVKRNGPHGPYWHCVNSSCKWSWS